jgi:cytochrome c oxidase assembly factor CtaG
MRKPLSEMIIDYFLFTIVFDIYHLPVLLDIYHIYSSISRQVNLLKI